MKLFSRMSDIARSPGDPVVITPGPSVKPAADQMARGLGWFSLALGAFELAAPRTITRFLGMEGHENLIRAYGAREIAAGMTSLSTEKELGLWSRVFGDALDIATLMAACRYSNPKRENVALALAVVVGITLLDLGSANAQTMTHSRRKGRHRDYSDRSGFPGGAIMARGKALERQRSETTGAIR
ncbi:hypothetical protein GCM10011385_31050 [Nitratireductor aestuarii]|uniref:Uncharacterized protein n=1 Tax=Nitratireductor aestuarii TaxID=1735103 RepID=A0A916RY13_9HYPH|nr:hypothetical protein [Nitratireductor aestuarii]GGA74816.1 hypothetical protein GCM10011385_31050 [Nitratireductor aestuarii]